MAFTPFVETDLPSMANFNEKFLECIADAVSKSAKIEIGSFIGTGVADETITIPTDGTPKFCMMAKSKTSLYNSGVSDIYIWVPGIERQQIYTSSSANNYLYFSYSEDGLSFYETYTSSSIRFNTGTIYYAIIT